MKIYAHMFILQIRNSANKVMASELRIDYSDVFKQLKMPDTFTDQKELLPQIHGKDMGNHLTQGDFEHDLTGKVIHKYIFDHETHFVGFGIYDTKTKTDTNEIGLGVDMSTVQISEANRLFIEEHETTRLIGFRTSKQCK